MSEQRLPSGPPRSVRLHGHFPKLTQVRTWPRLYVMDGFVSEDEAAHLRALTADLASWVTRGIAVKSDRTGSSFELPTASDGVVVALAERTYHLIGLRDEVGGSLRYRLYKAGEAHPPHTDTYRIGGLRLVGTAMVTLTGPEVGGETEFPYAGPPVMVPSVSRRLVLWLNHLSNGAEDPRSSHSSRLVEAGIKVTLTNFVYAGPDCDLIRRGPISVVQG